MKDTDLADYGTTTREGRSCYDGYIRPGQRKSAGPPRFLLSDAEIIDAVFVTQIILATILDRIFFSTTPTLLSVIGSLIILISAGYVAVSDASSNQALFRPLIGILTLLVVSYLGNERDWKERY